MNFAVHVLAAPYSHQGNQSALRFCQAVTASNHHLKRVFFSGDGVLTANSLAVIPQDETNLYEQWQQLAEHQQIELIVCISACLRRGIINHSEAERYERHGSNFSSGFILSGMGQLIEASLECDRLVTFGG